MTIATLDSIETAVYTALATLVKTTANTVGPFQLLERYNGQLSTPEAISQYSLGATPAMLLALDEDTVVDPKQPNTLGDSRSLVVSQATFAVLIVVQSIEAASQVVKGHSGVSPTYHGSHGAYRLISSVKSVLNNLLIEGTYRNKPLVYIGTKPSLVEAGTIHVWMTQFSAQYQEASAAKPTVANTPLENVLVTANQAGSVAPSDDTPDPTNPLMNPRNNLDIDTT